MILQWLFGGKDPSKECSKEALDKIDTEKMREKVEAAYYVLPAGATADEIASEMGLSPLQVRPRVSELKRMGTLWPTGERRRNASSNSCAVMIHFQNIGRRG